MDLNISLAVTTKEFTLFQVFYRIDKKLKYHLLAKKIPKILSLKNVCALEKVHYYY